MILPGKFAKAKKELGMIIMMTLGKEAGEDIMGEKTQGH